MKVSCEKIYRIVDDGQAYMVRFVKRKGVVGFSHKVLILLWAPDGALKLHATDWLLSPVRISRKVALYYCEKHFTNKYAKEREPKQGTK